MAECAGCNKMCCPENPFSLMHGDDPGPPGAQGVPEGYVFPEEVLKSLEKELNEMEMKIKRKEKDDA